MNTNQRIQTKTPEKEHVNMASQAECVLIFTLIFRCSGLVNATALTLLLESFARKSKFSRGVFANAVKSLHFFFLEALSFS